MISSRNYINTGTVYILALNNDSPNREGKKVDKVMLMWIKYFYKQKQKGKSVQLTKMLVAITCYLASTVGSGFNVSKELVL